MGQWKGWTKFLENTAKRPLVGCAGCFITGIWLRFVVHVPVGFLACVGLLSLLLAVFCAVFGKAARVRVAVNCLCAVIMVWLIALIHPRTHCSIKTGGISGNSAEITGIFVSDSDASPGENGWGQRKYQFRVKQLRNACDSRHEVNEIINVIWWGPMRFRAPEYGEKWAVTGIFLPDRNSSFQSCRHSFKVVYKDGVFLSSDHGFNLRKFCFSARRAAAKRLELGIESEHAVVKLIDGLLLGYRGSLTDEMRETFAATGTLHIFAISGLHVGIIAMLVIWILKAFRVSSIHYVLYIVPLLTLYTIATGARASAVRACVMAIVYYLAPFLGRKADIFSALAFAAIAILTVVPAQLFDVGFIYSFTVVAGIAVIYPLLARPMSKLWQADPFRIQPEPWYIVFLRLGMRKICALVSVSLSAWLVSAPLTVFFFGRLTVIAIVSNLVVIPFTFLIVLTGCLSLVGGLWINALSILLNNINVLFIKVLLGVMEEMGRIPFGSIIINKPGILFVLSWYLILGILCIWAYGQGDMRREPKIVDTGST